jgi:glycosyltransferase involved in cell wall biosynthesis
VTSPTKIHILVFGTDPASKRGGIAFALPAFFSALESVDITYDFIPTHIGGTINGKWWPWLKSFYLTLKTLHSVKLRGNRPVAYIHSGGGIISFLRKNMLTRYLNILSIPVVLQIHDQKSERYFNSAFKRYFFINWFLGPASAIAVLTPWWAKLLSHRNIRKIVHVIPNALSNTLNDIAKAPPIQSSSEHNRTVLAMSRIVEGKGFELIVEALPYLPPGIQVEFAGTGRLQAKLEKRIKELKQCKKVTFLGWLDDDEKLDAFTRADAFCLPSQYDSFGMSYIEAMAHGLPIVALNYGPIPDVVPNGKCGILIDKPDPEILANALVEILMINSTQLDNMQLHSKQWVQDAFGAEIVGHKVKNICEAVL